MILEITATNYETKKPILATVDFAKICPMCHTSFNATTLSAHRYPFSYGSKQYPQTAYMLYVIHFCSACDKLFFAVYVQKDNEHTFSHFQSFPEKSKSENFSELISKLSPNFVSTYNQALAAEKGELYDICGFGFRRALEFLIKDFAILIHPEDKAKIISMPLSQCINTYIGYNKLKIVATKAIWLGNDHAHYEIKHTDKDLSDLKLLVNLSVHWVTMELETLEAETIQRK